MKEPRRWSEDFYRDLDLDTIMIRRVLWRPRRVTPRRRYVPIYISFIFFLSISYMFLESFVIWGHQIFPLCPQPQGISYRGVTLDSTSGTLFQSNSPTRSLRSVVDQSFPSTGLRSTITSTLPTNDLIMKDSSGHISKLNIFGLEKAWKYGPVWAPDGAYILFAVQEDLKNTTTFWRVNPDGTQLQQLLLNLPTSIHTAQGFVISPDHKTIAFDFAGRIYTADEYGRHARILAGWPIEASFNTYISDMVPAYYLSPSFTNEGKTISFSYMKDTRGYGEYGSLYVNLNDPIAMWEILSVCPRP